MTSRTPIVLAALASLLLVGCTGEPAETSAADMADEVLTQFITDSTMISGFTISPSSITAISGEPPAVHRLQPESEDAGEPVAEPGHPTWVHGRDLDVSGAVSRAVDSLEDCDDQWSMVEVQVLTAGAVATRTTCEDDAGDTAHTVRLNDEVLDTVAEPISGEVLALVWGEIESAGLAEDVVTVALDRSTDVARVMFVGPSPDRTYEWNRGLTVANSQVFSHPAEIPLRLDLTALSAESVSSALDEQLDTLGGADYVERVLIRPNPDGDAQLVLTDADYMPLATVAIP